MQILRFLTLSFPREFPLFVRASTRVFIFIFFALNSIPSVYTHKGLTHLERGDYLSLLAGILVCTVCVARVCVTS